MTEIALLQLALRARYASTLRRPTKPLRSPSVLSVLQPQLQDACKSACECVCLHTLLVCVSRPSPSSVTHKLALSSLSYAVAGIH